MTVEEKAKEKVSWNDVKEKYLKFHRMDNFTENMAIDIDFGYWLANEVIDEALRWRDPKEELPENGSLILTKIGDDINLVDICRYMGGRFTLYYKNQYSDYARKPMFREDLTSSITYWRPIE